jgi:hypothetical protein
VVVTGAPVSAASSRSSAAVRPLARPVAGQVRLVRLGARRGVGDVDRQVDQHRARAAAGGDADGVDDRLRGVIRPLDRDRVLDQRLGDADHVRLLEGVRAAQRGLHLARDEQGRRRVHLRVGDRGDEVRRPGAGRADGDADAARRAGVALGGVAGGRLVAHQDVADRRIVEGVVDRQARPAGDAEDRVDAGALERADQGVCAAHVRCV